MVALVETNEVFAKWVSVVEYQRINFHELSDIQIAQKLFSEKHELAIRFNRLHNSIIERGLSGWALSEYKKEDFEILFEFIERGFAQKILGFDSLLEIFKVIGDLKNPENFSITRSEDITCDDCEGTGGTYVSGKCKTCDGMGEVETEVIYAGDSEEEYAETIHTILDGTYERVSNEVRINSYVELINRIDEEEVNIAKAIKTFNQQKNKPRCQFVGQDGNVFNLISLTSRTLEKAGLKEQSEEMIERVYESQSYAEALHIMGEYVEIY